jgi:hypothetical protein
MDLRFITIPQAVYETGRNARSRCYIINLCGLCNKVFSSLNGSRFLPLQIITFKNQNNFINNHLD